MEVSSERRASPVREMVVFEGLESLFFDSCVHRSMQRSESEGWPLMTVGRVLNR